MKYTPAPHNGSICENPQVSLATFAMCDKDGNGLHPAIKCRDFFSDVLMVRDGIRNKAGVYGFTCDAKTYSNIIAAMECPICVVDELNILIPGVKAVKDGKVWLYIFPEAWMENPILVSLSTGIMRVRNYDEYTEDDETLVKWLKKPDIAGIRAMTDGWKKKIKGDIPILTVHDGSGIISYIEKRTWWK